MPLNQFCYLVAQVAQLALKIALVLPLVPQSGKTALESGNTELVAEVLVPILFNYF